MSEETSVVIVGVEKDVTHEVSSGTVNQFSNAMQARMGAPAHTAQVTSSYSIRD